MRSANNRRTGTQLPNQGLVLTAGSRRARLRLALAPPPAAQAHVMGVWHVTQGGSDD
jgi:hypothetical protein